MGDPGSDPPEVHICHVCLSDHDFNVSCSWGDMRQRIEDRGDDLAAMTRSRDEWQALCFDKIAEFKAECDKLRAERDELHGKLVCETVIADQELQQFRAQRDKLLAALGEIAAMKGATLLGPDSTHRMGAGAPRYYEQGANAAFEQCAAIAGAAIADAAIANCEEKRDG